MERTVTVSNGREFFRIPLSDLAEARRDGFYLPASRECTIVSDGTDLYEIPFSDLADAQRDGFRDITAREHQTLKGLLATLHPDYRSFSVSRFSRPLGGG